MLTRRKFLSQAGVVLGTLALPAAIPHVQAQGLNVIRRTYVVMGTTVSFEMYTEDRAAALNAIDAAMSVLQRVHAAMSVQEPGSELWRWNESVDGRDVALSSLTAAAISEAQFYSNLTRGLLDPTVGAAVRALEENRAIPRQEDRTCSWDQDHRILQKPHRSVQIDLGGTAKGWAVDRAMDVLLQHGTNCALINAGGDLRCVGSPPESEGWEIGFRNPQRPDEAFAVVRLRDAAIATSGDYELNGSTLVDPRDLSRLRPNGSFSVVAPTCGAADCLATALCVEPDSSFLPAGCHTLIARSTSDGLKIDADPALNLSLL